MKEQSGKRNGFEENTSHRAEWTGDSQEAERPCQATGDRGAGGESGWDALQGLKTWLPHGGARGRDHSQQCPDRAGKDSPSQSLTTLLGGAVPTTLTLTIHLRDTEIQSRLQLPVYSECSLTQKIISLETAPGTTYKMKRWHLLSGPYISITFIHSVFHRILTIGPILLATARFLKSLIPKLKKTVWVLL